MYEAIVALPLIGAIIAGVITLVGARNRFPGANPPPPHDDHAAPLVPEDHARAAPSPCTAHAVSPRLPRRGNADTSLLPRVRGRPS